MFKKPNPADKIKKEAIIFPKLSYVIICQSLGFQPPMALVTRHWMSGRKETGFQHVRLNFS
jgi:hypothetical protein